MSKYLCLKPDDGSNNVWLIVTPTTGRVDATFLRNPKTTIMEIKLHNNVGTGYWITDCFEQIAEKWSEFKEIHK